jgi:5-methylcytosine-specific restriction endonuclease McrA
LDWIQFKWRNHDPQIGRFIEIDPLANDYVYNSTYAFSENKVTGHVELEGLEAVALGVGAGLAAELFPPILIGYVGYRILEANAPSQAQIEAANAHNAMQSGGVVGMNGFTMGTTTTAGQSYAKPGQAAAPALTTGAAAGIKNLVVQTKGAQKPAQTTSNTSNKSKAQQRVDRLSQKPRNGKDFTKAGKDAVKDLNKEKNNGETVCENCATQTTPAEQSKRGVTPEKTETQVDHIIPKVKDGSGTPANGQVLCRGCNIKKGGN